MHAGVAISGRYVLSMRQAALPLPPLDGLHRYRGKRPFFFVCV